MSFSLVLRSARLSSTWLESPSSDAALAGVAAQQSYFQGHGGQVRHGFVVQLFSQFLPLVLSGLLCYPPLYRLLFLLGFRG